MLGVMVEEDQFLGAAFHHDIHRLAPVRVSPAALAGGVLFRKVLRVIDEQVGAFGELAYVLVEDRMSGFVIRRVHDDLIIGLNAEAQAALRMVQPHRLDHAIIERDAVFFDVVEVAMRGHLAHIDGEVGVAHLLFDRALQATAAARRVKEEIIVRIGIQRSEERDALNMIPVEMGKKDVRMHRLFAVFLQQLFAQIPESGAAVEDIDLPVDTDFDAGGVAPISQVFSLGGRGRSTYAPESYQHARSLRLTSDNNRSMRTTIRYTRPCPAVYARNAPPGQTRGYSA